LGLVVDASCAPRGAKRRLFVGFIAPAWRVTLQAGVLGGLLYALLAYNGFFLRPPPMRRC